MWTTNRLNILSAPPRFVHVQWKSKLLSKECQLDFVSQIWAKLKTLNALNEDKQVTQPQLGMMEK